MIWRGPIELDDSTLLIPVYLKRTGATYGESVLMESHDMGFNWTYRSTIITWRTWMGSESPNESAIVKLIMVICSLSSEPAQWELELLTRTLCR